MYLRDLFLGVITTMLLSTAVSAAIEMRPRPTDEKDFPAYIQYLVDVSFPRTAQERAEDAEVKTVIKMRSISTVYS